MLLHYNYTFIQDYLNIIILHLNEDSAYYCIFNVVLYFDITYGLKRWMASSLPMKTNKYISIL